MYTELLLLEIAGPIIAAQVCNASNSKLRTRIGYGNILMCTWGTWAHAKTGTSIFDLIVKET
jgi:hypothetical protein